MVDCLPSCRIHDARGVFPLGTAKKFWDDIKKHSTEPLQGVFVCPHARAKAAAGSAALFCDSAAFDLREGPHWNPAGSDNCALAAFQSRGWKGQGAGKAWRNS